MPVDDDDDWASFLQGFNVSTANDTQEDEEDDEYVFQVWTIPTRRFMTRTAFVYMLCALRHVHCPLVFAR